ncbi:MAG: hypothetical protein P8166_05200 [Candidatus Thiodiazotropha sp.]|jgi:hypothetical protein
MVSPINADKPITAPTERSGEPPKNSRSEQLPSAPSAPQQQRAVEATGATLEVDKARQLFDLENQQTRVSGTEITTPDAARSLLDRILEQFSSMPEEAMKTQGSQVPAPLANLLQTAPA